MAKGAVVEVMGTNFGMSIIMPPDDRQAFEKTGEQKQRDKVRIPSTKSFFSSATVQKEISDECSLS
jgi:hypothetical protein